MLANAVAHGGGGGNKQQQNHGYQGNHGDPNRNNASGSTPDDNPNNPFWNHQCDICGKLGHSTLRYWKRFDKNFNGLDKMANTTTTSYNLDLAWYADSAATYHITGDLDKLIVKENYGGSDQVHTANDKGMTIKRIGQSTINTPTRRR
jgi:hypothetical protein